MEVSTVQLADQRTVAEETSLALQQAHTRVAELERALTDITLVSFSTLFNVLNVLFDI